MAKRYCCSCRLLADEMRGIAIRARCAGRATLILIAGVFAAGAGNAATVEVQANATAGHSGNLSRTRSATADASEIASAGVRAAASFKTASVSGSLASDLNYTTYPGSGLGSELLGSASGSLDVALSSRLTWDVANTFGQRLKDATGVNAPGNRGNVNVFRTGPQLVLFQSVQGRSLLNVDYVRTAIEDSALDSDRFAVGLTLDRRLDGNNVAGIRLTADESRAAGRRGGGEFRRYVSALTYSSGGRKGSLAIEVGTTRITGSAAEDGGASGRLSLSRQLGPSLTVTAVAGVSFPDAGETFLLAGDLDAEDGTTRIATQRDANRMVFGQFLLGQTWRRSSLSLGSNWSRQESDGVGVDAGDRETRRVTARAATRLGQHWQVSLSAGASDVNDVRDEYDEQSLGLDVSRRIGRASRLGLNLGRTRRGGSERGSDFVEDRALATFSTMLYSSGPDGSAPASGSGLP